MLRLSQNRAHPERRLKVTTNSEKAPVYVYRGEELARYGFGEGHPFGHDRHEAFHHELIRSDLGAAIHYASPRRASVDELALFHSPDYINFVSKKSAEGCGFLDGGDTPAFPGIFEAASDVAGTTLAAVDAVMSGEAQRAFIPIAGLHHAGRDHAAGFCVFNDCGIAVEYLRQKHGLTRVAYVDIDAHHGDGVFYAFEDDPELTIADIHEDGRYLYPGTGSVKETGKSTAKGTKLNVPMPPQANDRMFFEVWEYVEDFIDKARPEFILFQCGADSLAGDPITHMACSSEAHRHAAVRLCALANRHCRGRLLALGGGGYNLKNLADAWCAVVEAMLEANE